MVYRNQALVKCVVTSVLFSYCIQAQIQGVLLENSKHFTYWQEISNVH